MKLNNSKIIYYLSRTWLTALFLFGITFTIWAVIFDSFYTALLLFLISLAFFPIRFIKRNWIFRLGIFFVIIILSLSTYKISIKEINNRVSMLAEKPRNLTDFSQFSTRDKLGIYGLNIIMGAVAYPIYPEISKETLMMIFPPPPGETRKLESSFALKSKKIQFILGEFENSLNKSSENEKTVTTTKKIFWNSNEYKLGEKEARFALALNPSNISITATNNNSIWTIEVSIKVRCEYPQNSYVTLISNPQLKIEEGLFWVLQKEKWLHPYTAEWYFEYKMDSNRIK